MLRSSCRTIKRVASKHMRSTSACVQPSRRSAKFATSMECRTAPSLLRIRLHVRQAPKIEGDDFIEARQRATSSNCGWLVVAITIESACESSTSWSNASDDTANFAVVKSGRRARVASMSNSSKSNTHDPYVGTRRSAPDCEPFRLGTTRPQLRGEPELDRDRAHWPVPQPLGLTTSGRSDKDDRAPGFEAVGVESRAISKLIKQSPDHLSCGLVKHHSLQRDPGLYHVEQIELVSTLR